MQRYFIKLSYNGTNYHGWQIQDNTPHTVQQVLQNKLAILLGTQTVIIGCGRTDTGVHAKDYYAHFDSEKKDLHLSVSNVLYKLNKILPLDMAVKQIYSVTHTANARFDAIDRTYHYFIHQFKNPFINNTSVFIYGDLDFEIMNQAASLLLSVNDFTSFSKLNTQTKTNNCVVTKAQWEKVNHDEWVFVITANRFLHNMVRSIVGTLLLVGQHKITINEFKQIIESKDRGKAGMSVPAQGLYLQNINYPSSIFRLSTE